MDAGGGGDDRDNLPFYCQCGWRKDSRQASSAHKGRLSNRTSGHGVTSCPVSRAIMMVIASQTDFSCLCRRVSLRPPTDYTAAPFVLVRKPSRTEHYSPQDELSPLLPPWRGVGDAGRVICILIVIGVTALIKPGFMIHESTSIFQECFLTSD